MSMKYYLVTHQSLQGDRLCLRAPSLYSSYEVFTPKDKKWHPGSFLSLHDNMMQTNWVIKEISKEEAFLEIL